MAEGANEATVYATPEQAEAAVDENRHDALWLPNHRNYLRAMLGAFTPVGDLVGCIGLYQREDDLVGVIEGLFVRPSERFRGHATRLVRVAIDDAKDCRMKIIEIFTLEGDERAFNFWRKRLQKPPNAESAVTFTEFPPKRAIGWRLDIDEIVV